MLWLLASEVEEGFKPLAALHSRVKGGECVGRGARRRVCSSARRFTRQKSVRSMLAPGLRARSAAAARSTARGPAAVTLFSTSTSANSTCRGGNTPSWMRAGKRGQACSQPQHTFLAGWRACPPPQAGFVTQAPCLCFAAARHARVLGRARLIGKQGSNRPRVASPSAQSAVNQPLVAQRPLSEAGCIHHSHLSPMHVCLLRAG